MEEKKKNNSIFIVLTIILFILVIALGSYIIYDKIILNKNSNTTTEEKNNATENDNTTTENDNTTTEKENTLNEGEALALGNELWKYAYSTYWGNEPAWTSHTEQHELVCDTTTDEIKQKYTTDFIATVMNNSYSIDDFISPIPCSSGRGGDQFYKDTYLEIKNIAENEITYTAISRYCATNFCQGSNEIAEESKHDFIIKKQNDNWLISNFYLPN